MMRWRMADGEWRMERGNIARDIAIPHPSSAIRHPQRAFSLVEMLIALSITAMLLTATMVAIDASFHAYAVAAQSASSQTATRMVTHRLLAMIRTSTAHGPLETGATHITQWTEAQNALDAALQAAHGIDGPAEDVTVNGDLVKSNYIELFDSHGNYVVVEYVDQFKELWVMMKEPGQAAIAEPLLGGVVKAYFDLYRRRPKGSTFYVLERGSMDITVQPDEDNTMQVEVGHLPPIRVVASTMPRKLD